ncbi:RNA methyltransferase substrate-binding domain-containing protein [Pseudoroseomonas wenyumeiae]
MTLPPRRLPPRPSPAPRDPAPAAPPRPPQPRAPEPDRICGPVAVAALFAHRPQAALRLFYLPTRRLEAGPFCAQLARTRKPYREVPAAELAKIAGTTHHGGIVAIAQPRAVPALPAAEALPGKLLPVLDGIGNPHNLGAIARSAAFFGCEAMVISATRARPASRIPPGAPARAGWKRSPLPRRRPARRPGRPGAALPDGGRRGARGRAARGPDG